SPILTVYPNSWMKRTSTLLVRSDHLRCRQHGGGVSLTRHRAVVRSAMMPAMPVLPPGAIPDRPILVVDDDAKIVRLVRTYLERDGYRVVTAADGPAALDAIEIHQPALVVLDLMLPELDGRAVIRAVRRDEAAAHTPIIVLSARSSTIDRIAGL